MVTVGTLEELTSYRYFVSHTFLSVTFIDFSFQDVSEGDLINRATNLKNNGNNLLKDAKNAAKDLKGEFKIKNLTLQRSIYILNLFLLYQTLVT